MRGGSAGALRYLGGVCADTLVAAVSPIASSRVAMRGCGPPFDSWSIVTGLASFAKRTSLRTERLVLRIAVPFKRRRRRLAS